jgi:NAD(P)-dependent dehydrogenase (short-subunit alcohol dehydrogenase family)
MEPLTILITGGNDGIGRATAQVMLEYGHRVIITGRSSIKLNAAAATLLHRTGQACETLAFDLADLDSVRAAAADFLSRHNRLDVLINNAGIFTNHRQLSAQGIELQFAVNHVGHFLWTHLLLPALNAAPAPRIVNMASVAHYHGQMDLDDLHTDSPTTEYDGLKAYARSKLANVLFTRELARRYPHIASNCLHPGVIRTRLANKSTAWYYDLLWTLYKPFMRSARCGAMTVIYLSLSPEIKDVSGRYFDERQCCRKPLEAARDPLLAQQLWVWTEQAAGIGDR